MVLPNGTIIKSGMSKTGEHWWIASTQPFDLEKCPGCGFPYSIKLVNPSPDVTSVRFYYDEGDRFKDHDISDLLGSPPGNAGCADGSHQEKTRPEVKMSIDKSDMALLANRINVFVDLVQDPQDYFNRKPDAIWPDSFDGKLISAALFLLVDCYLRGQGIKMHPRSTSQELGIEMLSAVWQGIIEEIDSRPYKYPKLYGAIKRMQAAVELDFLVDGFSRWSDDEEF